MQKVKDQYGNPVSSIIRGSVGNLIVTDKEKYRKYLQEKESVKKINELEAEVQELKNMIKSLLEK